ncbi:MAG: hypothetical protein CL678_07910 [Bdellovibrionaceae bacterium]|nr:hypothetical protein [Pseudobdellovibrionaceae bacterium]|tara:strand:- start:4189 stop:4848 length:660 start_codon:yes stop_codon:yes gene_type:complete
MRIFLISFIVGLSFQALGVSSPVNFEISHIENQQVFFKVPEGGAPMAPLTIQIYDASPIGILPPNSNSETFLLLEGKSCKDCNEFKQVFLISLSGKQQSAVTYPGSIRRKKTGKKVFEGRLFYGDCLGKGKQVVVSHQKEKVRGRRYLQPAVLVLEPTEGQLKEQLIIRRRSRPSLRRIIRRTRGKNKKCTEIKGISRKSQDKLVPAGALRWIPPTQKS